MPLTLLFPWFAVAGLFAAAVVVATHLISARTRAPAPLPTARFVPRLQERSAAVERTPRDILLLLLRAGALALAGFALAAPVTPPRVGTTVKVAIADVAGSGSPSEVVARARQIVGDNGRVVISDSGLRVVGAGDPGEDVKAPAGPFSLTAPLVKAMREAAALGGRGNPVELTIVSGFTQGTLDSATASVRALWPGTVRLVDMPVTASIAERGPVRIRADDDDPLHPTVNLLPAGIGVPAAILRDGLMAADSRSAREGGVIVHWPRDGIPQSFTPATADTVGGLWVDGYTLVARFPREAALSAEGEARVVARWIDGAPAAVERRHGAGCIRDVAISVPTEGDLSISSGFRRIVAALVAPCGAPFDSTPLGAADRAVLAGSGPRDVVLHSASSSLAGSQLAAPLLLLALLVLLAELVVRKHR